MANTQVDYHDRRNDEVARALVARIIRSQAARRRTEAQPATRDESGNYAPSTARFADLVHGLSAQPLHDGTTRWRVTCDGCGHFAEGPRVGILVLTCGILFNPLRPDDSRRLCHSCAAEAWGADR